MHMQIMAQGFFSFWEIYIPIKYVMYPGGHGSTDGILFSGKNDTFYWNWARNIGRAPLPLSPHAIASSPTGSILDDRRGGSSPVEGGGGEGI